MQNFMCKLECMTKRLQVIKLTEWDCRSQVWSYWKPNSKVKLSVMVNSANKYILEYGYQYGTVFVQ